MYTYRHILWKQYHCKSMVTDSTREQTMTTTVLPSPGTSSSDLAGKLKMINLKALTIITVKRTTFWMQNYKGNSCHLLERNKKPKPTVNFRKSQIAPMCIFFSVITYGKLSPHALHIPLVCQTSPGLCMMNRKSHCQLSLSIYCSRVHHAVKCKPLKSGLLKEAMGNMQEGDKTALR